MSKCCNNCDCNCNCEEIKNGLKIEITSDDSECAEKLKKAAEFCKQLCC